MSNKNCNVPYDQIPHIVINHPDTIPEHWAIMICLYKLLKDKSKPIIYTNQSLAENCRISLRGVERRIPELEKMGFIKCTGRGYNRRISLGELFYYSANMAVSGGEKLNNSAKFAITTAKNEGYNRHIGGDSKNYSKNSSNAPPVNNSQPQKPLNHDPDYQKKVAEEFIRRHKPKML